jgi:hypothetical protein
MDTSRDNVNMPKMAFEIVALHELLHPLKNSDFKHEQIVLIRSRNTRHWR